MADIPLHGTGASGPPFAIGRRALYYLTSFLASFLLFQVQPMCSKALLPAFGGSYLVWGSCVAFFQGVLLCGYAYAHVAQRRWGVVRYGRWHPWLLALPLASLPLAVDRAPVGAGTAVSLVTWLFVVAGPCAFALTTVSLVLQRWYAREPAAWSVNPYVLYSASNLGSLSGLLTYPVLVEPWFALRVQGLAWSAGYAVLVALHLSLRPRGREKVATSRGALPAAPGPRVVLRWLLLSAAGCAALLAVTNVLTFDMASVPFLWVLPLSVYLLTFVLAFQALPWPPGRAAAVFQWAVWLGVLLWIVAQGRLTLPAIVLIPLQLFVLFGVCMGCHHALVARRPAQPEALTAFYLALALGGALGSAAVTWGAPLVTRSLQEYPAALVLGAVALAWVPAVPRLRRMPWPRTALVACAAAAGWLFALPRLLSGPVVEAPGLLVPLLLLPGALALRHAAADARGFAVGVLLLALAAAPLADAVLPGHDLVRLRNFYGIYRVFDRGEHRYLQHGMTHHGQQRVVGEATAEPVAYYHPETPAALALRAFVQDADSRVAMIGLGAGAMAFFVPDGATFAIYELDADNVPIAREQFTYLRDAEARGVRIETRVGDGRVRLREAHAGTYDALILDAFNSGSIPVHLLTVEALREYARALRPSGFILLHVSNRLLDLPPVIARTAHAAGLHACFQSAEPNPANARAATDWVAVAADPATVDRLTRELGWLRLVPSAGAPWTDRHCNLLSALRW